MDSDFKDIAEAARELGYNFKLKLISSNNRESET